MKKTTQPFTNVTFNKIYLPWISAIASKQCLSVINLPKRDQVYRVHQFFENPEWIIKQLKSSSLPNFLTIDLAQINTEDPKDFSYLTQWINSKYQFQTIILLDSDLLLSQKTQLLSFFNTFAIKYHISIVYLFQTNICYLENQTLINKYSTLINSIYVYPYYSKQDAAQFISLMEYEFDIKIPSEIKKSILYQCGGCLWLIKEAIRYFKQTKNIENLSIHQGVILKLNILLNELTKKEQRVLYKISIGQCILPAEKEMVHYFLQTGLVQKKGQTFRVSIPLLTNLIGQQNKSKAIFSFDKKGLYINQINMQSILPKRERKLLKTLLIQKRILSRDEIATVIWGKEKNYSDWALDQMIKRLRKRLSDMGINPQVLQTKKRLGYFLQFNNE